MDKKRKERMARYFATSISRFIRTEIANRGWKQDRVLRELRLFFEDCGDCSWDEPALSRYLHLDENEPKATKAYYRMETDLAIALCQLLGVSIYEAAGVAPLECRSTGLADPDYVRKHMRGRLHPSMCKVWADRIQRHFKKLGKTVRVFIAPTHEFGSDDDRLEILGQWGAAQVDEGVWDKDARRVLVGLGKHVNAAVSFLLKRPAVDRDVEWLPSMGTYAEWDFFSANEYCTSLHDRFGGKFTVPLRTPGFVPYTEDDEFLRHVLSDSTHRRLFGDLFASAESQPKSKTVGRVQGADTTIAGCGIAAPGNPLWETPYRAREPRRLRQAECPAIGDLNGHYLCVAPNGDPVLLSEHPLQPDKRNLEAWDANRRALGATPRLYQAIAERHRKARHLQGGGVIVMANAAGRAPAVVVMLQLGLVNQIVLDAECGRAVHDLLESPRRVASAVPARADW